METLNLQPPSVEWLTYRNDTTEMTMLLVDENDKALDLTDWNFTGKVREYPTDASCIQNLAITKNANSLTVVLDNSELTREEQLEFILKLIRVLTTSVN